MKITKLNTVIAVLLFFISSMFTQAETNKEFMMNNKKNLTKYIEVINKNLHVIESSNISTAATNIRYLCNKTIKKINSMLSDGTVTDKEVDIIKYKHLQELGYFAGVYFKKFKKTIIFNPYRDWHVKHNDVVYAFSHLEQQYGSIGVI